jgi:polyisoprenoid-binding protein YceI
MSYWNPSGKLINKLLTKTIDMAKIKWAIDSTHSEVQFKVKHMMISTVTGYFSKFDASVETEDENFETAKIDFTADLNSISTNNEQRDAHLRTSDFFDVENHPQITFKGNKLEKVSDDEYKLTGDLTIRGNTKPVTLAVDYGGMAQDPWGNTRVGFTLNGKISRKEFGLHWNAMTETGGIVVGDEVKLHINAEFIKQQAAAETREVSQAA